MPAVEDYVVPELVDHYVDLVVDGDVGDCLELLLRHDAAARVVGVADEDELGLLVHELLEALDVELVAVLLVELPVGWASSGRSRRR